MNETLNKTLDELAVIFLIIVNILLVVALCAILISLYEIIKMFWNKF